MKEKKDLNTKELNQVLSLTSRILKILYIVMIIGIIFIVTITLKEWKILQFILKIIKIISPILMGLLFAWLLNPLVTKLSRKAQMSRLGATSIIYLILISMIIIFFWTLIPVMSEQINDLSKMIPSILSDTGSRLNDIFNHLESIEGLDIDQVRFGVFNAIEEYGRAFMVGVPVTFVKIVTSLFSGIGQIAIGLLVGFYLLLNLQATSKHIFSLVPKKYLKESKLLAKVIDMQLHKFVKGTILSSSILMLINIIGFIIVGLKAPLLFGLFCGLTNIIPYIGPYIGGIPAIIVGFSQGTVTGLLVLIVIVVSQMLEGNILHPLIMSKSMKLNPVTIIVGLLIFGSLFGIVGMVIATPAISLAKILGKFLLMKLKLFDMADYDLASEME